MKSKRACSRRSAHQQKRTSNSRLATPLPPNPTEYNLLKKRSQMKRATGSSSFSRSPSTSKRAKIKHSKNDKKRRQQKQLICDLELEDGCSRSQRREKQLQERVGILSEIKKVFDSNKIPLKVQNRDKEKTILMQFMKKNLRKDADSQPTLIITGQPGVGKTLLLKDMMKYFDGKRMCELSCMCHMVLRKSRSSVEKIKKEPKVRKAFALYCKYSCICNPEVCPVGELVDPVNSQLNHEPDKNRTLVHYFKSEFYNDSKPSEHSLKKTNANALGSDRKERLQVLSEMIKSDKQLSKIDYKSIKSGVKENRRLLRIMNDCFFNTTEGVIEPQDRRFKFILFNSTLYSNSVNFLREILKQVVKMFEPYERDFLKKKLNLSSSIGNVSLILNYIRKLFKFLGHRYFFVIIIDELDSLAIKDAKNIGYVVEFLNSELNNIVRIGVSNTYGLSSQVFDYKVQKDVARLIFAPYSEAQLKGIIQQRLKQELARIGQEDLEVVDNYCLTYLFKKYMKNSWGDIRFLLKIFQEIIEKKIISLNEKIVCEQSKRRQLIEEENEKENISQEPIDLEDSEGQRKRFEKSLIISIKDSIEIINQFFTDKSLSVVDSLSLPTKILLYSICQLAKSNEHVIDLKELKFFFGNNLKNYRNDVFDKMESYLADLENYNIINRQAKSKKTNQIKLSYASKDLVEKVDV